MFLNKVDGTIDVLESRRRLLGDTHPATAESLYNLACLAALQGKRSAAMDWLRQSVDAGYLDSNGMSKDPTLESLHGDGFDALVERVRRNAAAQRED